MTALARRWRRMNPAMEFALLAALLALWMAMTLAEVLPFEMRSDFHETLADRRYTAFTLLMLAPAIVLARTFRRPWTYAVIAVVGAMAMFRWDRPYSDFEIVSVAAGLAYMHEQPHVAEFGDHLLDLLPVAGALLGALLASRRMASLPRFVLGYCAAYGGLFAAAALWRAWLRAEVPDLWLATPGAMALVAGAGLALGAASWLPRQRRGWRRLLVALWRRPAAMGALGMACAAAMALLLYGSRKEWRWYSERDQPRFARTLPGARDGMPALLELTRWEREALPRTGQVRGLWQQGCLGPPGVPLEQVAARAIASGAEASIREGCAEGEARFAALVASDSLFVTDFERIRQDSWQQDHTEDALPVLAHLDMMPDDGEAALRRADLAMRVAERFALSRVAVTVGNPAFTLEGWRSRVQQQAVASLRETLPLAAADPAFASALLAWCRRNEARLRVPLLAAAVPYGGDGPGRHISGCMGEPTGAARLYPILRADADLLELAAAVLVHCHRHGVPPESLGDLAPELLPAVRRESVTGMRFGYRLGPDEAKISAPGHGERSVAFPLPRARRGAP